ncbi:MAG: hypothetical protein ABI534_10125 [Chloroflexota bacterium]
MPKPKKPQADAGDADKLIRQAAGSYRTADERFEVREAGIGWYLVDTTQHNEFGQELLHGPYDTLKDVRAAIPGARTSKVTPIRPPKTGRARQAKAKSTTPEPKAPPPPTWIQQLPDAEATKIRRMIRALERQGLTNAEKLVRRDREGLGPVIAEELITRRLAVLVADLPSEGRDEARVLIERITEILTAERGREGLPGWALVEIGPEGEPPNRRITLR